MTKPAPVIEVESPQRSGASARGEDLQRIARPEVRGRRPNYSPNLPITNADNSPIEVYSVNYFDNYDFDSNGTADYTYDSLHLTGLVSHMRNTRGQATGSRKLILGTNNWIKTAVFYDKQGRAIQTQGNNHLYLTGMDKASTVYDFEGKVTQTKTTHTPDGTTTTTLLQTPRYDAQGRLVQVLHSINGAANQLLAQYSYNELGQVVGKHLHGQSTNILATDNVLVTQYNGETSVTASGSVVMDPNYIVTATSTSPPYVATITTGADINGRFLQNVDYRYNIKGWLTSINNAQLVNDQLTNTDTNDYFGMEMNYNTDAGNGNTLQYNGNVSSIKWKNAGAASGTADQKSYKFAYDKTDKLTSATFQKYDTSAWNKELNTLDETMGYDHNGNILTLTRNQNQHGLQVNNGVPTVTSTATTIDNLSYTYASGNQLSKVSDASSNANGFNDGSNTTTEYTYDTHGNLTQDLNKGINSIIYNVLGKAQQITFSDGRVVNYTYDASGNKLKVATTVGGTTTATDYANGFVYNTASGTTALSFLPSPEGRVVKNASGYEYQYAITDHQGNTRILFTSAAQTTQTVTAGFETANQATEASNFNNYQTGAHINTVAVNANTGSNSLYLNGGYAGQVGIAKTYKVFPGDQLGIQAYAKYNTSSGTSNLNGFATALLTAFNLSTPAPGETGTPASAINTFGGLEAGGYGDGTSDSSHPKVFVNIVLFDRNYNFLDVTYAQLTTSGALMSAGYTVKEAGYAYMYVSNENPALIDVYFDDVSMSYTPTRVLQSNEYYPFGATSQSSWTRDNTNNNFLYDAGSELNNTTGMYDLPYRNYDASLGRFFQIDPLSHRDHTLNPYHYAGNNPIGSNDPSGLMRMLVDWQQIREWSRTNNLNPGMRTGDEWASDDFEAWAQEAMNGGGNNFGITISGDGKTSSMLTGDAARRAFAALMGGGTVTLMGLDGDSRMAIGTDSWNTSGVYTNDGGFVSAQAILGQFGVMQYVKYMLSQQKTSTAFASANGNDIPDRTDTPWMGYALGEWNVGECGVGTEADNMRILGYFAATWWRPQNDAGAGVDSGSAPWCAAFVNWCLDKAGIQGTKSPNANSFADWGQQLSMPAFGSIGIYCGGQGNEYRAHVGFFVGYNGNGQAIMFSGNWGNNVGFDRFDASSFSVFAYPVGYTPGTYIPNNLNH